MIFLVVLGFVLLLQGGITFSPGPVSAKALPGVSLDHFASHAEFEKECDYCHQPLKTEQASLCLQCHQDVKSQIELGKGIHSRATQPRQCAACHSEHRGRNFDPTQAAITSFDHTQSGFTLDGKHAQVECHTCHIQSRYDQARSDCISCHPEPQSHAGMFGANCSTCHTTTAWKPASIDGKSFDHSTTGFSLARHLQGEPGKPIGCPDCHQGRASLPLNPETCKACHAARDGVFIQQHTDQFGLNCLTCHDGVDRMHAFSHAAFFKLDGGHASLNCNSCHAEKHFRGTPTQCSACHAEPAIHAGFFGLQCADCHTTSAWTPALLQAHNFPLDHGGKGEIDCKTCHPANDQTYTCTSCHEHQPADLIRSHAALKLKTEALADCKQCHLNGRVNR